MSIITPDFSEMTERKGFEPLPSGTYPTKITAWDTKEASNGINYLRLTLTVSYAERYNGRKIFYSVPLSGPHTWVLKQFLGILDPDWSGGGFDPSRFIGRALEVQIEQVPGEKYPKVKGIAPYFPPETLANVFD